MGTWEEFMAKVKASQSPEGTVTAGRGPESQGETFGTGEPEGGSTADHHGGDTMLPEGYADIQRALWEFLQLRDSTIALNKVQVTPGVWHRAPLKGEKARISYKLILKNQQIIALVDRHIYGKEVEKVLLTLDARPLEGRFSPEDLQALEKLSREKEKDDRENKRWLADYGRGLQGKLSMPGVDQPYLKAKSLKPEDIPGCLQFGNVEDHWFRLPHGDRKWLCLPCDGLFIPIYSEDGALQGFQTIEAKRGEDGKFAKRIFGEATGGRLVFPGKGGEKDPLILLEGAATAASTYRHTGYECWWCMSSKGLKERALEARRRWPERIIIIGADNDVENERNGKGNAGREAAEDAVKAVGGAIAVALCPAMDGKNTDFNDWDAAGQGDVIRAVINNAVEEALVKTRATVDDGPKPGDEGFEWPEPVPFSVMSLPKLTPDMLPDEFGKYCAALAEAKQVPLELAVSMALAALSAAAVASYELEVRPGYREPPIVYTLCPLEPANRKSAVCSAVMEPLIEWEKTMAEELGPEIRRANSQRKSLEKAIDHKRAEYARAEPEDRDRIQREIDELEAQMPEETALPRVLTDSVTPEALAVLMKEQGECMAILSAEGGIFDIVAGMYNKGVPNMDLFLKSWCRESYRVDRRSSESVLLDRPALVMGLTTQPFTMVNRTAAKAFRGRGLDGRFLYFLPESILGRRKVEPEPMREETKSWFNRKLKALLPSSWGKDRPQPQTLSLSKEAYQTWLVFSEELEKELAEDGEFDGMTDWGGKLAGYVARLAELFHLASHDNPAKEKISPEIMTLACQMGGFLTEHAKAAYALMGTDETLEGAKKIHGWIKRKHVERFTTQAVWQDLRRTFCRAPALREALTELVDRFYIYEIPTGDRTGPGRKPAPSYLVNPRALEV